MTDVNDIFSAFDWIFGQDDIKFHCLLFVIGHNMKINFKLLVSASILMLVQL